MHRSTDVRLERSEKPIFPNRCVACGRSPPDIHMTIWGLGYPSWQRATGLYLIPTSGARVRIPACRGCSRRIQARRLAKVASVRVATLAGYKVADALPDDSWRRVLALNRVVLALGTAIMLPFVVWQVVRPPALDLALTAETVTDSFRSEEYAREFAALNRASIGG